MIPISLSLSLSPLSLDCTVVSHLDPKTPPLSNSITANPNSFPFPISPPANQGKIKSDPHIINMRIIASINRFRRTTVRPNSPPTTKHRQNHQQWRTIYTPTHRHLGDVVRVSKTPRRFCFSSVPSHSYSSSSSSDSKMGFLKWYLGMLESRPVITKAITSSLIYTAADLTSQIITLPPAGSFDSARTLRMAGFGMLLVGPSQHMWFNFIGRILPKRDVVTTLKKLCMGQALYGPCLNGVFFSYNAALQGESGNEIVARLKRDLLPTLMNGLMFWPMCDFLTYKVIPVHLQPLMNSCFSYIWSIYLTYVASLKKASID